MNEAELFELVARIYDWGVDDAKSETAKDSKTAAKGLIEDLISDGLLRRDMIDGELLANPNLFDEKLKSVG